jgi:hypothetical protein
MKETLQYFAEKDKLKRENSFCESHITDLYHLHYQCFYITESSVGRIWKHLNNFCVLCVLRWIFMALATSIQPCTKI